jgi:hypothetical protein
MNDIKAAQSPRTLLIRKHITTSQLGAEIGPFHSPLCPKSEGFNCLVVDAFSRDQLLKDYAHDTYVMDRAGSIEDVDIVSTQPLGEALASYATQPDAKISSNISCIDYIVSSHNFEHQPNPIRFLQDAEAAIRPGGHLVMAIPVASRCFDCFQSLSRTGEFIDAYYLKKTKPSVGSIFDHQASSSKLISGEAINDLTYDFEKVVVNTFNGCLDSVVFSSTKASAEKAYVDSHCWRFNPFQFELIFSDLKACGLIKHLTIIENSLNGSEFIVHISRSGDVSDSFAITSEKRTALLKKSIEFQYQDLLKKRPAISEDIPTPSATPAPIVDAHSGTSLWAKTKAIIRRVTLR